MNLFDLTEGKVKKQTVNEGIEIVYEKVVAEGLSDTQKKIEDTILKLEQRLKFAKTPEQWDNIKNRIERLQAGLDRSKQDVAEDNQWHSDSSDQWHGQGGDAWHGATSDEWHGTGQGAGPATGMPAMKEADTAERLKRNLKKNGFDMDRFDAKIAEIERRNRELSDEFYARHPELDDRIKDESATMFTSIGSDAGAGMGAATLGTDNDISPVGSGTVDEGYDNEVGFGVNSEQAYNAVMTKFGDYIEHRDDGVMYAPRELWSAIEQTAFDADGVGAEEDSGIDEDQYGGGFGGGGIGPVTDSTSPVGGGGASVEEGLGAYDNDQGVKHTRGSLVAKLEALPRGSDDFEWNRQRAIQHLKQGNMIRAKYYMMLMKRGEQGVAEENLNELSPKTLGSYINKANKDVGTLGYGLGDIKARPGKYKDSPETVKAVKHAFDKRIKGVEKAANRLIKQQGVSEGSGNWYIRYKGKVLKDKKFNAIPFPSQEAAHGKAMELHSKKRYPLELLKLTQSWMDAPEQGVAEAEEQGAHVKYYQGYNDAKNSKPSIHKTLTGNDRHNYVMGYKDGLTDRKKPKQQGVAEAKEEDITEDIYESRLYKMKLAGFFDK